MLLAYYFWSSSRYPALNEKAIMGGETPTTGIGFDEWYAVDASMLWYEQILNNTLNWVYTNKQGMTFGVLFATGLLMLFSLIKKKNFKSHFLNAGAGLLIGAPLGVCVNCAAPIAQGMRKGGAGVATSLAAMVSSPTLNVVVLGMLFSLFPWYMVGVKLILTFTFILIAIPLITKIFPVSEPSDYKVIDVHLQKNSKGFMALLEDELPASESFFQSVKWFIVRFFRSFWYILKMTVPLMLLAGFLGNVIITFLPWDLLADVLPASLTYSRVMIGLTLILLAAIGLFLPVPMAFDIIICAILLAAGIPEYYVMALLFSLGIFSIYSFFIVRQAMSVKIALASVAVLLALATVGGLATKKLGEWNGEREIQAMLDVLRSDIKGPEIVEVNRSEKFLPQKELIEKLEEHWATPNPVISTQWPENIRVGSTLFGSDSLADQDVFEKVDGQEVGLGIDKVYPTYFMIVGKISNPHGLASGDIHGDGWQDLAVVSTGKFFLFANAGGKFIRQSFPVLDSLTLVNVALVDMNNDSWLDVVLASEGKGNYLFLNKSGDFSEAVAQQLPNTQEAWTTRSMAFADFDRDRDLDILFSNYTVGNHNVMVTGAYNFPEASRNALVINENPGYQLNQLPTTIVGESLTSLWSDINNDGWMDIIEGNDFSAPDVFYLNKEGSYDKPVKKADEIIEIGTESTMSMISGDINNDLKPEVYLGQIALSGIRRNKLFSVEEDELQICGQLTDSIEIETCKRYIKLYTTQNEISRQRKAPMKLGQTDFEFLTIMNGIRRKTMTYDEIPPKWEYLQRHFERVMESNYNIPMREDISEAIASEPSTQNVLLQMDEAGKFKNRAKQWGIATGGYTWNAKFADLNADEFLDLFIVNGSHIDGTRQYNFLYLNQKGTHFENHIEDYPGLNTLLASQNYTYIDIDNDGDQDIISATAVGPLTVHINRMNKGNMIAFELRDALGNSHGVGSKIVIYYGKNGEKHQVRELLASGGHLSFDPYIAYFGLGDHDSVKKVIVQWSTGEETVLEHSFLAGERYIIYRDHVEEAVSH
jgi:uncharacterized membrane protein YraQ (UPF0718 family)